MIGSIKKFIQEIYASGEVVGQGGEAHKLLAEINQEEGEFLYEIIRSRPEIVKTLEVGCAYGLSSLHICMGTHKRKGASHIIIDPFQSTEWDSVGVTNLKRCGIDFFELIESKSEFALPKLLEQGENQYDFIFVDGWHTFDHTLLDCFYSTRLLRSGGLLVIDDASWPSVKRVVRFLENYPCYVKVGSVDYKHRVSWKKKIIRTMMAPVNKSAWAKLISLKLYQKIFNDEFSRMIALRKINQDERNWDWHNDDF